MNEICEGGSDGWRPKWMKGGRERLACVAGAWARERDTCVFLARPVLSCAHYTSKRLLGRLGRDERMAVGRGVICNKNANS